MSHKRMMMKDVTSKTMFISMSKGAQLLYFHLNMESDDDGIAEAGLVMRMIKSKKSDLDELIKMDYVTLLEPNERIVYINDWHAFNSLGKYLVYPSVHRALLLQRFPRLENVLFKPKNNILSRRKSARSKEIIKEEKRRDSTLDDKIIINRQEDYYDEPIDDKPFK